MKIIYVGAQSTGKSTILKHYESLGHIPVITEVVRKLTKQGVKINEQGDNKGQELIFDTYYDLLSQDNYMSDRGLVDVLAYTKYLYKRGKISERTINEQKHCLKIFNQSHDDILYVYFPIEFEVVDDGVRSLDEGFRHEIDQNIQNILTDNNIPYLKVSGSVEERIKIIDDAINKL